MQDQPYLIFELHNRHYGLEAQAVQEIFFLPEVTAIAEAPTDVIGVINLRGSIVPVIDLSRRLGHPCHHYSIHDSIIVLSHESIKIAVVVNAVYEVQTITADAFSLNSLYSQFATDFSHRAVTGIAKWGAELVTLLSAPVLINSSVRPSLDGPIANGSLALHPTEAPAPAIAASALFFPDATPDERQSLRQRAEHLMHRPEEDRSIDLIPYAVVSLQGERFAIGVDLIREFTQIRKVTPIPCCPPHIVGNVNLRGEILTLVDIRQTLHLQMTEQKEPKAVVVRLDQLVAGITVDDVFDMVYIHPSDISPIPTSVRSANEEYLRGAVSYQGTVLSILDLPKMLAGSTLVVNESV
jgi:purine-binding chemotaxis protein CheW